ncbi:MAG: class I SAM-dependent methyltransferase [Thermodesulfovibrionia bacterium]|nr:class I SAM-dependent methyltransferase [Thermodesulfovibrionia bacterium]
MMAGAFHLKSAPNLSNGWGPPLDLGAGNGVDLDIAKAINPSAKMCAVEFYEPNIAGLKSRDIEVHQLDIERDRLPFENESVDIVIANQFLEHTKEIFWIMHETSRILKINGKLILGVPNLASLHNRLLLLAGMQPTPIQLFSAHVRAFTKSGLLDFLDIYSGYELIDFKGSNFYPFPPIIAKSLAKMFPSLAWGNFFLLEKKKKYSNEFLDYPIREKLQTNFYLG